MNKTIVAMLVALPFASFGGLFNEYAEKITTGTYSFESPSEIEGWNATNGSIEISGKRAKVGGRSSLWKWNDGGYLLLENPEGLKQACEPYEGGSPEKYERKYVGPGLEGGVKLWLYNATPSKEGKLFLQVGNDASAALDSPRYKFPVNLDFQGWRAVWVHFAQDAKVAGYKGPEAMVAMALVPSSGTSGALNIDWVNFVSCMSLKRHSDYQVTNNKPTHERYDSYTILEYDKGRQLMKPAKLGPAEIKAFSSIRDRLEYLVLGSGAKMDALPKDYQKTLSSFFKKGNEAYEKLNITEQDGVLNGTPLFSGRDEHVSPDSLNLQEVGQNILFPLALEYRVTKNPEVLERAMMLLDFLNDQGFAVGSANGTADHMIRVNSFGLSMLLLQEQLESSDRMERDAAALAWFSMLGSAFSTPEDEGVNTDFIRGTAFPKLISVLLMEDSPEKAGAMVGLVGYFNHVTGIAPGYSDTIKPDYTLYHHRSAYQSAYGVSMLNTMVIIDWLLDGTVYELSGESKTILTNALDAQLKMANTYDLHPGISGRIQTRRALDKHLLPAYAFSALSGDEVDLEKAAVFNRLYKPELNKLNFPSLAYNGTLGTAELMDKVAAAANGKTLAPDEGHYTFPYGAFSTHRRDDWMACVRGWSQYVWDFESGSKHENDLGRYISHGAMFIIPEEGLAGSAQDLDTGYHWGFLPGATTKALPVEETVFKYVATPKYLECKHRNYTDETFCGGVSMAGNGFFSMVMHDTVAPDDERILFDDSFRATKSYFFVDGNIYCLGTGIENTDERFATATTLFQNTVDFEPVFENGTIRDANGNVYVVPGDQKVEIRRGEQKSWGKGGKPSKGANTRAWINHGKAPKDASYEYMVAVNAKQKKPHVPFEVLQKDSVAHVIGHISPVRPVTAYAIFDPASFEGQGIVSAVDTPLLLMAAQNEVALKLAVADPDLRLEKWGHNMSFMPREIVHAEGKAHTATITLAGEWKLSKKIDGVKAKAKRGKTTVQIELQHGFTKELLFKEVK
ncbi:chondroitinase family polysaccharide lyase [Pontiella sulfatireligans]|uniref:Chondroitin sulfate ABC exolyase n=1 Tax=Pontiella sulfatireligans TaxID=2750658 RepID=A0A6C2UQW2_9BACT|nr:chondroitinase family polysaccharide lyase [Pontiella sulfatireligans]VGO22333.1 Chondroitin sulfate ABC exolyase [Pontiella sulfatireligans]